MRFDDRLLTVWNQLTEDRHDTAVRRQLVDLVARSGSSSCSPMSPKPAAIRDEARRVEELLRAATARAVAALPLPLGLLEYFASDSLTVSALFSPRPRSTITSGRRYSVADDDPAVHRNAPS